MKLLFYLSVVLLTFTSCTITEKPEFIKVNSIEIVDTSLKSFTIQANLLFLNKNSVGGTIQARNIHVNIDSIQVASINTTPFSIPKKETFEVPLMAKIPFEKVYNDNKQNLLNNIMNIISSKKITINYKGSVRYQLSKFHYDYPLDYTQELSIKK